MTLAGQQPEAQKGEQKEQLYLQMARTLLERRDRQQTIKSDADLFLFQSNLAFGHLGEAQPLMVRGHPSGLQCPLSFPSTSVEVFLQSSSNLLASLWAASPHELHQHPTRGLLQIRPEHPRRLSAVQQDAVVPSPVRSQPQPQEFWFCYRLCSYNFLIPYNSPSLSLKTDKMPGRCQQ
ncbi:uncharacterized protein RBU33_022368 [Hipposideros larvatus]